MSEAFLIHALRTAVVPHSGAFAALRVADLGAPVVCALRTATGIAAVQGEAAVRPVAMSAELPG